jgi:hypothetical protein
VCEDISASSKQKERRIPTTTSRVDVLPRPYLPWALCHERPNVQPQLAPPSLKRGEYRKRDSKSTDAAAPVVLADRKKTLATCSARHCSVGMISVEAQ